MKIAIFAAILVLWGCESPTDKKLDQLIEKVDSLEASIADHDGAVDASHSEILREIDRRCNR